MIKKLYTKNWDYQVYQVDEKLVASIVFFGQVDYTRSFYVQANQLSDDYELLDNLSEKIRANYSDYKKFELEPAITSESSKVSDKSDNFTRECFYLESAEKYFFKANYKISGDISKDIKTLLSIYSAGLEMPKIDDFLFKIIKHKYNKVEWVLSNIGDYYLAISLLSFIKVRFPKTPIADLEKLIPFTQDRLMTFIALDSLELDYSKTILNLNPYIYLHNYIVDKTGNAANADSFLVNFYKAVKGLNWHDSHKNNPKEFFGYWSVSLAAIVQKLQLADHFFMDHMYYPRDLINRELMPTWEDSPLGEEARAKKTLILDDIRANLPAVSEDELKQLIVSEYEEVLNTKNRDIFSESFKKQVTEMQKLEKESTKMESAKAIKSFVRDFAFDITQEVDENHPFNQLLNNEELISHISKVISQANNIKEDELETELLDFLDSEIDVKIQKEQLDKFQKLGADLLKLDEKYTEDEEAYWNELEQLFEPFQTPRTDPMIELKNSIAETITKKLQPDGKAINFNFSIDDFF